MSQPQRIAPVPIQSPAPRAEQRTTAGSAAVDPAIPTTLAVLDRVFGPPEDRSYDIRLWDGTVTEGRRGPRADFSLHVRRRGALRRMLLPPSELSIVEAFISNDIDIDGNVESA